MDIERLRRLAHDRELQIAIDGPAGAGKSTVGRGVADALAAPFLDTGLMYRAVTWLGIQQGISPSDAEGLGRLADETEFASATEDDSLLVNGAPLERELRSAAVDGIVSVVSAHPNVRAALVRKQRAFANRHCAVMVGRDIGTTVLPDAQVKLWITASAEERARRRLGERLSGSTDLDVAEMADRIRARDALDSSRAASPLSRADDAVVLNTDSIDEPTVVEAALRVTRDALERREHPEDAAGPRGPL